MEPIVHLLLSLQLLRVVRDEFIFQQGSALSHTRYAHAASSVSCGLKYIGNLGSLMTTILQMS